MLNQWDNKYRDVSLKTSRHVTSESSANQLSGFSSRLQSPKDVTNVWILVSETKHTCCLNICHQILSQLSGVESIRTLLSYLPVGRC